MLLRFRDCDRAWRFGATAAPISIVLALSPAPRLRRWSLLPWRPPWGLDRSDEPFRRTGDPPRVLIRREAARFPECQPTVIGGVHTTVHAQGAEVPSRRQPQINEPPANSASPHPGQKIHVHVGRKGLDHRAGHAMRMVDHEGAQLIGRPVFPGDAGRILIGLPQARPPFPLKVVLKCGRIDSPDDIATDTEFILCDKGGLGAQRRIRRLIDMPYHSPVGVLAGRIATGRAGGE